MPGDHYGQWLAAGTPVAADVVAAAAAAAPLVVHAPGPLVHLPPRSVAGAGARRSRTTLWIQLPVSARLSFLLPRQPWSLVSLGLTIFASL